MFKKTLAILISSVILTSALPINLATQAEGASGTVDTKTIDSLPTGSARNTVSLDGTWACTTTALYPDASKAAVPKNFNNTIPVPGMWDSAATTLTGDYTQTALWFKTTVNLTSVPDANSSEKIILQIKKAQYGRYIYVNGQYVGEYLYNYSQSETDITKYLKAGANEIAIMLGSREQEKNDASCPAHTGFDGERSTYYPGITDDVNLVLCGKPEVTALQVAPNLTKSTIDTRTTLSNSTSSAVTTDVTYNVYERGVYIGGVSSIRNKISTYTQKNVTIPANGSYQLDVSDIPVTGCSESKWWSPENPYLYEVEVVTSGDTFDDRFGMRTFTFDPTTKLPMLNGKVYYLRGTNIAMNRFYDDPQHGNHPWDEQWARELIDQFKSVNMNVLRMHLGDAPSVWYEAADEEGYLIDEQYAWWGNDDKGCTLDTLMPEFHSWIDLRQTNPCIITWNIENEFTDASNSTGQTIQKLRSYDISNRPWDNGWNNPMSSTDPVECHPYFFLNNSFTLSDLNSIPNTPLKSSNRDTWNNDNPKINDEYGWIWLQRDGTPSGLSSSYYSAHMPGATNMQRRQFYADATAELSEYFREGRHYDAVMQFGGLIYSRPDGNTGDILCADLSTPRIRPEVRDAYENAFAPLGIVIADYSEKVDSTVREKDIPVTVLNDYNSDVSNLSVNLTLYAGSSQTPVYSENKTYNLKEAGNSGDRQQQVFSVQIPNAGYGSYTLVASYSRNGKTVSSKRTWTVNITSSGTGTTLDRSKWTATAQYSSSDAQPAAAFDGSTSTRWANGRGQGAGQYYILNMGSTQTFNQISMVSNTDYPAKYSLYSSNDGTNWTPFLTDAPGNGGTIQTNFTTQKAQYLKIELTQPVNTAYWWSIYELNLSYLGSSASDIKQIAAPDAVTVANGTSLDSAMASLPKTVSATLQNGTAKDLTVNWDKASVSPSYSTGTAGTYFVTGSLSLPSDGSAANPNGFMPVIAIRVLPAAGGTDLALDRTKWTATAEYSADDAQPTAAFDDSTSTRWANGRGQGTGQYYILNLGSVQSFNKLSMLSNTDNPAKYSLYSSNDGVNWTPFLSNTAGNAGTIEANFPEQTTRYVKIELNEPVNTAYWWSIYDLNLYQSAKTTDVSQVLEAEPISVKYNVSLDTAKQSLPQSVTVKLQDSTTSTLGVTWTSDSAPAYDAKTPGAYVFTGTLQLPQGQSVTNSLGLQAQVTVDVMKSDADPNALDRSNWTASASCSGSDCKPAAAIDGDKSTRWANGMGQTPGQFFMMDLGSVQTFNAIQMVSNGTDYAKQFSVSVSNDKKTWTTCLAQGNGNPGTTLVTIPTQQARYVKISMTKINGSTYWWSIYEFNLYNLTIATDIKQVTQPSGVSVAYGTALSAAEKLLPSTVPVLLKDGTTTKDLSVTWSADSDPAYNGQTAGNYTFTGTLVLPTDGSVTNGDQLTANVTVAVQPQQQSSSEVNSAPSSSSEAVSSIASSSSAASSSAASSSQTATSSAASSSSQAATSSAASSSSKAATSSAAPSSSAAVSSETPSSQDEESAVSSSGQDESQVSASSGTGSSSANPGTGNGLPVSAAVLAGLVALAGSCVAKRLSGRKH